MLLGALISCDTPDKADGPGASEDVLPPLSEEALAVISPTRMKAAVDFLADDALGGRITGSPGHAAAMAWLLDEMADIGLEPAGLEGDFVYPYPATPPDGWYQLDADGGISLSQPEVGYDLVGRLPGADPALAKEHILVMAHYDHLGVSVDGEIYNGAFDNASGVAVVLELARVLSANPPDRSVIFLITDEEETGLEGARAWLEDPTIDAAHIRFGLSVDPVGRPSLPDYWPTVLIGTERSPEMDALWPEAAAWNAQPTTFIHRDLIPVFSSDQDRLYELDPPIPGFWFVNPGMSFYHTPDDTPETIDYRILRDDVRFLAQAITLAGKDTATYSFEPEPPLDGEAVAGVKSLIVGLLASEELSLSERNQAEWIDGQLDAAIEADDISVLGNIEGFTMAVAYFVMFELGAAHPGPIPPPFPED
jgi:hypothetical protein